MEQILQDLVNAVPSPAAVALNEAREQLARIDAEIALLEGKIAMSTDGAGVLEARRLERGPDFPPDALASLSAIYESLAGWRPRVEALRTARATAVVRLDEVARAEVDDRTAELRQVLRPYQERATEALGAAVEAAKEFAKRLRVLGEAERARTRTYGLAAPKPTDQGKSGEWLATVSQIFPTPPEQSEPLYGECMQLALKSKSDWPFWRLRANLLTSDED